MAFLGISWTTIALTAVAGYLLTVIVRKYLGYRRDVNLLCKLPGMETEFLFGNSRQMPDLCEAGLKWMRENCGLRPRISIGWMGPFIGMVNVVHPDTVKVVLKSSIPKSRNVYQLVESWLGQGLLVSNGRKWARSRRLLTPAFHFDILKQYLLVKNNAAGVLVNKMQKYADEGEYFEVFSDVCLFSLDVILQCAFSYESDCQNVGTNHPYIQAVSELNELLADRFFKFWLYPDFLYYLTSKGRRWKRACNLVHTVAEKIIADRKQKLDEERCAGRETPCRDFLGILLTAQDEDGTGLTPGEIRNEVDTFLFEGHDTTTSGTSWILYSIAKYSDVQKKLHEEIDQVFGDRQSEDITWEDLSCLPYMTMVIKESLRLNPPVTFIQRVTDEPVDIGGFRIPAATNINIIVYNILNNPTVWKNSQEFIPERFSPENTDARDPFAFVPFSAGPRNCIGQIFAMNEMKTVVARIMRRFWLELDPDHVVQRQLGAVLRSKNGIRVRAVPRKLR
ncbi:CP4F2-like protein [Mya arenaria]|uniref:CP4F2-like protein n=1 Tax=Mya arenaria TaxID=6604 RepID=A0ABY7E2C2_MYAAR|nr:cytochrome P450 4F2-like [Mya arenaria]WAR03344.1 CP4F2-like protein [Mya arenaria]